MLTKLLLLLPVLLAPALADEPTFTLYLPHLADGGAWKTVFTIVNISDNNPGTGVLKFHAEDGSALPLKLAGSLADPVSQVPISLPTNGTLVLETAGTGATTSVGWAELNDTSVPSALFVTAVFRESVPGSPDFEAAVLGAPVATKAIQFAYDNSPGFSTGLSIINSTSLFTGVVSVTVRDEGGKTIATESISMAALAHLSFALAQRYPATIGHRGIIKLTPDSLIWMGAMAFRFNPTGPYTALAPLVK